MGGSGMFAFDRFEPPGALRVVVGHGDRGPEPEPEVEVEVEGPVEDEDDDTHETGNPVG